MFIVFFLINLRVLNWFEPSYIVMGGDFRPPLVPSVFLKSVLYTWNDIDWGIPSIYSPRILDPFYFFFTVLQSVGASTYLSQLMATYLIYFFTTILVYLYVKRLANGDKVAAFVAGLFFTSNVHLIVDREQTAIGFINMSLTILPCLVVFAEGLKRHSYGIMAVSGLSFVLTYGAFPNYRAPLLCLIGLLLTLIFVYIDSGLRVGYNRSEATGFLGCSFDLDLVSKYVKCLIAFFVALLLASIWIMTLVLANFNAFLAVYNQMAMPVYVLYINPYDVLRLIAKWSFYQGALGHPYVPYASMYNSNPLILVLTYVPTLLAFAAMFASKSRKLAIYFGGVAGLFLILTSSFTAYFNRLYSTLTNLPLMAVFREPTNWIFLVILSFSVLIGVTLSNLCRRAGKKAMKILVLGLAVALFLYTSYPLLTGDITKNWLNPEIKGSYFPPYFNEVNSEVSSKYWTIMLPQRSVYVIYNFSNGGVFACGNPYPLIFSKPILSGGGTEYIQSENLGLMDKVQELILTNKYENAATNGTASASSAVVGHGPSQTIDGKDYTNWASKSGMPQSLEIDWNQPKEVSRVKIVFGEAYAKDYTIETWNGSVWTIQIKVENKTYRVENSVPIWENNAYLGPAFWSEYTLPQLTATTKLRLNFTNASSPSSFVSIWELVVFSPTEGVSQFLGFLGIKNLLVERNIISGSPFKVNDLMLLNESKKLALVREWDGASLLENEYALEKLYTADNIQSFSDLDDLYSRCVRYSWSTLQHSAFMKSSDANWTSQVGTLVTPESLTWEEESPTSYKANVRSNGRFLLVFLESYNSHWKAFANGQPIPESNHVKVNAFANGWLVNTTGDVSIAIEYETQNSLTASVAASVVLPTLFMVFLVRRSFRKIARRVQSSFRRRKDWV